MKTKNNFKNLITFSLYFLVLILFAIIYNPSMKFSSFLFPLLVGSGLFLDWKWSVFAIILYLLLGFIGLPILNKTGGAVFFTGENMLFYLGCIPGAILCSYIAYFGKEGKYRRILKVSLGMVLGLLTVYIIGAPWYINYNFVIDYNEIQNVNIWKIGFTDGILIPFAFDIIKSFFIIIFFILFRKFFPELLVNKNFDKINFNI